jgi:hypothetical protein
MKYIFSTLALAATALANPVPADAAPSSFSIEGVVYGGSGCPQGSLDINWTDKAILPISTLHFPHLCIATKQAY